jgi:hypothetical protein
MKVAELYIMRRAVAIFCVTLLWVMLIVWTTQILVRINLVTSDGQSVWTFFQVAGLVLPAVVPIVIPFAIGVAVAWALAAYVSDHHVRFAIGVIGVAFVLNAWFGRIPAEAKPASSFGGIFWGGLSGFTSTLSQVISNTATTVLVAPIAFGLALELGVSPYAFLMTVAFAASTAFLTPIASPVNTLVLGPGEYRFSDFFKAGILLQLLVLVATILTVPLGGDSTKTRWESSCRSGSRSDTRGQSFPH